MFRKVFNALILLIVGFIGVYLLGPRPEFSGDLVSPTASTVSPPAFAKTLAAREAALPNVKPQARAEVVFANADSNRTPYVFVYLHGFSASRDEGSPVLDELAQRYGANLYWTRLSDHGLTDTNSFHDASPSRWRNEAAQFLADATALGDTVLLFGTSTGGTLAIDLAARFPERVKAVALFSPNIALADGNSRHVNGPWGEQLIRLLVGGDHRTIKGLPPSCDYIWTITYHLKGIVALQELLETTMTEETFAMVKAPTLAAYYYRDEAHKDEIVSTEAISAMVSALGTPAPLKRDRPLAEVSGHVITTDCRTTGLDRVREESKDFLETVVGLRPIPTAQEEVE